MLNENRRKLFLFLSVLLGVSGQTSAQSVYVPLNHWSYEFVERMEAKGLISGALNGTRPYSRAEMAGYILQVVDKTEHQAVLNSVEFEQLQFLRFEFQEEFVQLTGKNGHHVETRLQKIKESKVVGKVFPNFIYRNNRNLFNIGHEEFQVFIDPILSQRWQYANPDSIDGTDRVLERTHGFTVWGGLGSHIGFFFDFRDTKEWGSRTYPQLYDISMPGLGFVNGYGTHIWHDETVAYMVFKLPYLQLILGKDDNYWGPGFHGALGLSNNATSYDQIKLQSKFWRLKFTWFWGFLRTYPVVLNAAGETAAKNLVGHRLEIDVAKWLDIGLYEMVVFGNRRFELAYVNPINFYRSAEHFVGDDDNASMGLDFDLLLIPNVKLYGELFVDDLNTSRGSDFFGNKVAYLTGALWADAFTLDNFDLRLEYARTRPFLYSHRQEINKFTHFNTGLGHWIGPNADDFYARAQYRLSKSFYAAVNFEYYRHGANEPGRNVGGDINQSYPDESSIRFLDGIRETRKTFGLEVSYEIFRNFYFGLNFNISSSENMLLPKSLRGPVSRDEVGVSLSLNR